MPDSDVAPQLASGRFNVPAFEGVHGSILFVGPQDTWRVEIDDQDVTLSEGDGAADCVLSCKERGDLLRLVRGEQNLVTALLQGRITVEGDAMLAVQVAGSMPTLAAPEDRAQGGH